MNEARFVWHELMTVDPMAAKDFYPKLFGWTWKDEDLGELGTYTMWLAGGRGVGGMVAVDKGHGFPSQWHGYAHVPDVDAAVRRAEQHGAQVPVKPHDIPGVGRAAMLVDAHGASLWAFRPTGPEMAEPPAAGHFCWDELHTPDVAAAGAFYGETFGWKVEPGKTGGQSTYHLLRWGAEERGGLVKAGPGWHGWLGYVWVDDVDAMARQAEALGGKVVTPPADTPWGRSATVVDPTGARFALWKSFPRK